MNRDALYYPKIALHNSDWIKSMALLYDSIYRVVPDNVIPEDSEGLQALLEEGSVGKKIDPSSYAESASESFLDSLENWDAAALSFDDEAISRLHTGKMDAVVRELFTDAGFKENNDWLHVPAEVASNFMLYMARDISVKNNLSLLTDSWGAWTGTTYFNINGKLDDFIQPLGHNSEYIEEPYGLFSLLVTELSPVNISEIPAEQILNFRIKRADEIENFRKAIFDLSEEIKNTDTLDISIDRIERKANEFKLAQEQYKKSADLLKVKKWFGVSMMGIPAPVALCNLLSIPTASTLALGATGVALGGLYNTYASREEIKKLNKENPSSFLVELNRSFKGYFRGTPTRQSGDINMYAWNCMEEFVAD